MQSIKRSNRISSSSSVVPNSDILEIKYGDYYNRKNSIKAQKKYVHVEIANVTDKLQISSMMLSTEKFINSPIRSRSRSSLNKDHAISIKDTSTMNACSLKE